MITEEEAKTKMCQETIQPVATNDRVYHEGVNCIGAACMAWRWHGHVDYEVGVPLPEGMVPADPGWEKVGDLIISVHHEHGVVRKQQWRRPKPRPGYCGKAGGVS